MRRIRRMSVVVGLVASLGALGAGPASAATIGPAGTAFTGYNYGEQVLGYGTVIKVRCNQVRLTGTTPSPATSSTLVTPAYGSATGVPGASCKLSSTPSNAVAMSFATTAAWTLNAATFNPLTGTSTGSLVTAGTTTFTSAIGSCVITYPAGTTFALNGEQYYDPEDGNWLTEWVNQGNITYTATNGCAAWGLPSGSHGGYTGGFDILGLAIS